ncbi:PAAR-like domain-containing protein [Massilia genomosp. 1]|uniref:DUF4150 domain-containing protein n=1 Tax=Massilia genomosp. 1 TaxID=2609280 RepID=A0ABX0MVH8_9BURK|nr:PAAR-like domain-containing protein [Massilia genomosp. 1]NHZ61869.1 DUF4150 domain-containing protein [Massilia genomosp. 1]
MQTHVYANDQEIACKAAGQDGISPQAFPDPCWSPAGPPAGPVVIPYPNTCFAESISNGTSTIRICGKESAIEDHSYFATSTGNEPATQAFGKGVATSVITGKAYFTQWSFDVVFEGFGVPRHTDMVSHNHGSMPSNTPLFPYLSRSWGGHACDDEQDRIKRACRPEKDESEAKREIKGKSKLGGLLKDARKASKIRKELAKAAKAKSKLDKEKNNPKDGKKTAPVKEKEKVRDKDGWHWTDDHCDGLDTAIPSLEEGVAYAKEMEKVFESLPSELNILNGLKSQLQEMVTDAAGKAAGKWLGKAALKQAGGSAVPAVGNILMGIWSVVDAAVAVGDIMEIKKVATESLAKLDVLKAKLDDLKSLTQRFADFKKLKPEEQLKIGQRLASDGQDMLATVNDCTRARKCNLVPYSGEGLGNTFRVEEVVKQKGKPPIEVVNPETRIVRVTAKKHPNKVEPSDNGGCCDGQTGHHLVSGASVKADCPAYDHDAAPTVCAEGTSQHMGSHGRVHDELARAHNVLDKKGKVAGDGTMSMSDALDSAADSHEKAFPLSKCSKKCIRAQLEAYYQACKNTRPKMVDKNATPVKMPNTGRE